MNYLDSKFVEAQHLSAEGYDYSEGTVAMGENLYADGTGRKEISLPIIINAENTGTAADTLVELFNAISKAYSATPEISGTNSSVVLTSGIQGRSYAEIIRSIAAGTAYRFNRVRINCLAANTDSDKNSAPDASISYTMKTDTGKTETQPLYPEVSSLQNVLNIRDVKWDMLINHYASVTVESIPAGVKLQYKFYAEKIENSTTSLVRGNTAKNMEVVNPNQELWK